MGRSSLLGGGEEVEISVAGAGRGTCVLEVVLFPFGHKLKI